jgi:hypothetical protein
VIWGRIVDVFRRRRLDAELNAQLAFHQDGLEADFREQGLTPDEARAAARRAMGGLTQVQDAYRDQLTVPVLEPLWQDVRYGCRAMRHNLTFTVVVVLTLALGIGANTAVFTVINSILLKPLPYPQAEELVAQASISLHRCISPTPRTTGHSSRWACGSRRFRASRALAIRNRSA